MACAARPKPTRSSSCEPMWTCRPSSSSPSIPNSGRSARARRARATPNFASSLPVSTAAWGHARYGGVDADQARAGRSPRGARAGRRRRRCRSRSGRRPRRARRGCRGRSWRCRAAGGAPARSRPPARSRARPPRRRRSRAPPRRGPAGRARRAAPSRRSARSVAGWRAAERAAILAGALAQALLVEDERGRPELGGDVGEGAPADAQAPVGAVPGGGRGGRRGGRSRRSWSWPASIGPGTRPRNRRLRRGRPLGEPEAPRRERLDRRALEDRRLRRPAKSTILQGTTVEPLARRLGLTERASGGGDCAVACPADTGRPWRRAPASGLLGGPPVAARGHGADGRLTVGGCALADLAAEFGTPALVLRRAGPARHARASTATRSRAAPRGHRRALRVEGAARARPSCGSSPRRAWAATSPPAASSRSRCAGGFDPAHDAAARQRQERRGHRRRAGRRRRARSSSTTPTTSTAWSASGATAGQQPVLIRINPAVPGATHAAVRHRQRGGRSSGSRLARRRR